MDKRLKILIVVSIVFILIPIILLSIFQSTIDDNLEKTGNVENTNLNKYFSSWDGSHTGLKKYVKDRMHDASSFEHVETKFRVYNNSEDSFLVTMKFRGTNAFGAKVLQTVIARCYKKDVVEVIEFD